MKKKNIKISFTPAQSTFRTPSKFFFALINKFIKTLNFISCWWIFFRPWPKGLPNSNLYFVYLIFMPRCSSMMLSLAVKKRIEKKKMKLVSVLRAQAWLSSWYLYEMVTQKIKRTCEEKQVCLFFNIHISKVQLLSIQTNAWNRSNCQFPSTCA